MGLFDRYRVKKSLEVLLRASDEDKPEVVQALSRIRQVGKAAIPQLIEALGRSHASPIVEKLLISLLDDSTLPLFCDALATSNRRVVTRLVGVLSQATSYNPHQLLEDFADSKASKADLIRILASHGQALRPDAVLGLLDTVDRSGRSFVFRLLDEIATEAMIPLLIARIQDPDWRIRLYMTQLLQRFSTPTVRDTLTHLLSDSDKSVRQEAVTGLANLTIPVDTGPICQLLRDPDLTIQNKAIDAIIQIDDPQSIHSLLDLLQDESEYVRRGAVEVLNRVANTQNAMKELLGALRDKDWWVRVRAADALGKIGGPRVVEAVLALLDDGDEFVRRCAVEVLNVTQDKRAFGGLVKALDDEDWWVRERAVDALASLGDQRAVPALLRLLEHDLEAGPVVTRALASLGDERAIRPLLTKLQTPDPTLRKEVLQALSAMTDETHAADVQQAIAQMQQVSGDDLRDLVDSTMSTIVMRFGDRIGTRGATTSSGEVLPGRTLYRSLLVGDMSAGPSSLPSEAESPSREEPMTGTRSDIYAADRVIDASILKPGDILADRYRVIRTIGKGAFGIVLLMEDMVVHDEVILKFLNPTLASDEHIIERFIQELRYARRITHENIIRIYDFITLGKSYAISMEYFQSHSFADELKRTKVLEPHRGLKLLRDICRGMSAAHQAQIVHRDLKPQNILINDNDLVKVVDFGLAAAVSATDPRLTKSGLLVGTPAYIAPEQVQGQPLDARTDIYSLGVIMYESFTGRPPYRGQDTMGVLYQHVEGKAQPPRQLNEALSPELEAVILRAMAVDPEKRYQSMDALRESIEALPAFGS
jgi:HEAT repeat protein/tRNA A-37 threonylcarbamoyl transferase component Bud32